MVKVEGTILFGDRWRTCSTASLRCV